MYLRRILKLLTLPLLVVVSACTAYQSRQADVSSDEKDIDRLYVYPDGSMKFNDRFVDEKHVIIYANGQGGERAAVKMYVPLHPDFFRDSIHVVREDEHPE